MAFASILCLAWAGQAQATGYTLTVYSQGSGTIAENPTNSSYPSGVTVTLTAAPSTGWYFANWSGNASGTNNPLNVTMNSNLVITGAFLAYPTYTLSLVTNGQGTIVLNPPGGSYYSNTTVTVTATPASGWLFTGWSGASTSTNDPLNFALKANSSLTGNFVQLPAFDLEPVNVTNAIGSTVTLSSHSVGTAPVYYQWFFNNGPLNGATNPTLIITNTPLTDAGNYWVAATNAYGSVTSSVVVLALTNTFGSTNVISSPTDASLRSAIAAGGWVIIACNGTFNLTNTINITQKTTLDGTGVSAIISGSNAFQLFNVAPSVTFSITNLTLANGSVTNATAADGGAIYNNGGTLNLISCLLTNNTAVASQTEAGVARGGAIFNNAGNVYLYNSGISNNSASSTPQLSSFGSDSIQVYGGAIYTTNGSLTIIDCSIQNNVCGSLQLDGNVASFGGALFQASGSIFITNSSLVDNSTLGGQGDGYPGSFSQPGTAYGGALAALSGTVVIDHSQFLDNTGQGGNSGYHSATGAAFGGAIFSQAYIVAGWSTFAGNRALSGNTAYSSYVATAGSGGAIYTASDAEINDCSFCSNSVQGGAIFAYGNSGAIGGSGLGGALFNDGDIVITNCTITLNSAAGGSSSGQVSSISQLIGSAFGGGIYNAASAFCAIMNSTIATNSLIVSGDGLAGTPGYAAGSDIANTNGTVLLQNSLLAYGGTNGNSYGPITDQGYNISSDGTANLFGGASYNFTDPQLAPLANNGGPTLTMALLPTSPAIGLGTYIGAPATDQRGYPRPTTSAVDSGAYQYIAIPQTPTLQIGTSTNSVVIAFAATATNVYVLQSSTDLKTWINVSTNGPFGYSTNFSENITQPGAAKFFRLWMQ